MRSDTREKYLQKYAGRLYKIESNIETCRYAVVIPAISEYENLRKLLNSLSRVDPYYFKDTLFLLVINNHVNSTTDVKDDNKRSLDFLRVLIKNGSADGLHLSGGMNIGLIDAASEGCELPEKSAGVGLARKTGMDAVLNMFPDMKGIIICTDADCTVEKNYLTEVINAFKKKNFDAAVINFMHRLDDPSTAEAAVCYEIFLRFYVAGLGYADSPFAFHSIGSAMACTAEAYINVEGMNKRKAAEDFYFLEKLAKNYSIGKINTTAVYPSPRKSWRVPFGTGQRVNRFLSNKQDEFILYDPHCFAVLKEWHKLFMNNDILTGSEYLNSAKAMNGQLYNFLCSQGFEKDWQNIVKNVRNTAGIVKQKIRWFDGFRTLKLIHHLRDKESGVMPMFDALDKFFNMVNSDNNIVRDNPVPEISVQKEYLQTLRELEK